MNKEMEKNVIGLCLQDENRSNIQNMELIFESVYYVYSLM